eukprot:TRINITY_DN13071_c0_g1_i1.p1 TRINITY_DN13071_c0_g1~~TRINITY_DN13071_c0_g1_i1.p1  ORF type:complete len:424 (+),score=94.02 TRINITY_DN13071_c0_g1_i1:37-1308(+)
MLDADRSYRVIAVGKKGSGKSTILNSLTHSKYFGTDSSRDVEYLTRKFKDRFISPDITFIDTPGFSDISSRDNKVIPKIVTALNSFKGGHNLVLFCFPAFEIPFDSSMQACWKFLKLIMHNVSYEHISIILTHGNRLNSQELEEAVARMTTKFIPYIKDSLRYKVKEEILIYESEGRDDGLDGVLGYITVNGENEGGKLLKLENGLESVEYLLQNSRVFNQIQDLVVSVKERDGYLEDEIRRLRLRLWKEVRKEVEKVFLSYEEKMMRELSSFESFKNDIKVQIKQMKEELSDKDRLIKNLTRQLDEPKPNTKKISIETEIRNKYLQLDTERTCIRTRNINHFHSTETLPGNYHISPATEESPKFFKYRKPIDISAKFATISKLSETAVHKAPAQIRKIPLPTQHSLGTVSYTHLTLPTICSV